MKVQNRFFPKKPIPESQWGLADLYGILERGEGECRARVAGTGEKLRLQANFTPREWQVLLAGGLLAYTRAGGEPDAARHTRNRRRN